MNKLSKGLTAAALVSLLVMCGCNRDPEFKVQGEIYGAEGKTLILEKADFVGRWIALDSTHISKSGSFSMESAAPASPEIYRLSMGDRFIYFPVDSIETIRVESSADKFGTEYTLSGTPQAELLARFDKELHAFGDLSSGDADTFKKNVYTNYIKDSQGSIISYYVLTKMVGGKPLFDPADKGDARYYAAVATQYEQYRPDDPHGKMVQTAAKEAMRRIQSEKGPKYTMEVPEITVIDIELPDEEGKNVKLSDMVGKGKKTIVVFSLMNAPESPGFNRELNNLRQTKGVEYYHISLDGDQYVWREAAKNLPWTTVFDASGMTSNALLDYNVRSIPAFYIYDASGTLVDSAFTLDDLIKKL